MRHRNFRFALALSFLVAARMPAWAQAENSLSVKLDLAGLPSTITLCRDPSAIAAYVTDEQWNVFIDVDNNTATGMPGYGFDVALASATLPQEVPCVPTSASTASSLVTAAFVWDAASSSFVPTEATVTITPDFVAHSITLTTDLSGALSGFNGSSRMFVSSSGAYQPTLGPAAVTQDGSTSPFTLSTPLTLPANDVRVATRLAALRRAGIR